MPPKLTRAEYHRLINADLEHIDELNSLIKQAKSENKPAVNLYKDLIRASEKHIKHMLDYQKEFKEPFDFPPIQSETQTKTHSKSGNADSGIETQSIPMTKSTQQDQYSNEPSSPDVEETLLTPKTEKKPAAHATQHPFNRAHHPHPHNLANHYSAEIATPAITYEYNYTTTNVPP